MPRPFLIRLVLTAALAAPLPAVAQSVVVDEGTFTVTMDGKAAGTERFTIRRAGVGNDAIVIANGVVQLDGAGGAIELSPLLEVIPLDDVSANYQLKISGSEDSELSLRLAGRRYVARIQTPAGEEEREFLARAGTRIIEEGVAHHHYFLRSVRDGSTTPVIEPRTSRQLQFVASAPSEELVQVGGTSLPARKVTFSAGGDARSVWFDAQGRLLRVEIPSLGYVAHRQQPPA